MAKLMKKQEFMKAQQKFLEAARELSSAWDRLGGEHPNPLPGADWPKYPFELSFDEQVMAISEWIWATKACWALEEADNCIETLR